MGAESPPRKEAGQDLYGPVPLLRRSIGFVEVFTAVSALFRNGEDLFPAHRAALGRFRRGDCERFAAGGAFDVPPGTTFRPANSASTSKCWPQCGQLVFIKNTSIQFHLMKYSMEVSDINLFCGGFPETVPVSDSSVASVPATAPRRGNLPWFSGIRSDFGSGTWGRKTRPTSRVAFI